MKLIRKLLSCVLMLIFFNAIFLSYSYADNLVIENNGTQSTNGVAINSSQTTTISQQNTSNVSNTVNTSDNSGNNTAINNTGGVSSLTTGNASSTTNATTVENTNTSQVAPSPSGSTTVSISDNGSGSTNKITSLQNNTTSLSQINNGSVQNSISSYELSGGNNISNNTGSSSTITTGETSSQTNIKAAENKNIAVIPSLSGTENITLEIKKNGSNSLNTIVVSVPTKIKILSSNALNLINSAHCYENSGKNNVSQNVGSATLSSGHASCKESVVSNVNENKIKMPKQEICQNIPPVTSPNPSSSTSSQSTSSSGSSSSSPSSSSSSTSSSASYPSSSGVSLAAASPPVSTVGQVLGVSVLPSTGLDLWKSLLFYLVIGLVGLFLRVLPQKKFSIHVVLQ